MFNRNKTNNKQKGLFSLFLLLTTCLLITITACQYPLTLPKHEKLTEESGWFLLVLDESTFGRTIMPNTAQSDFVVYTLEFFEASTNTLAFSPIERINSNLSTPIQLNAGTWELHVYAYMDIEKTKLAAQGELKNIVIGAGATTSKSITLEPIFDGIGTGSFSWNISYPSNVIEASMIITRLPLNPLNQEQTISITGASPQINSIDLKTGFYRIVVKLKNNKELIAEHWETLHVYQNMKSTFSYTFTENQFNSALTGTISINGIAAIGQTLTATTDSLGGSGTISYQWMSCGINIGTNSSTYTIQPADAGSIITVTVRRSDNSGTITSSPTETIPFPPLTGTVSLSGTARVGNSLTASTSSLGGYGTISYQWIQNGVTNIGTNNNTYNLQDTDIGTTITVIVTRSGNSGSVTSASVTVSTEVEIRITCWDSYGDGWNNNAGLRIFVNGTIRTNLNGLASGSGPAAFNLVVNRGDEITVYWRDGGQYDYECAFSMHYTHAIPSPAFNPNPNNWSPANDPNGRVLLYKQYGSSGSIGNGTLMGSFTVSLGPTLTGSVSISGTAQQGQTLTANTGSLGGTGTISYQWKRGTTNIGTNSNTYVLQVGDVGSRITVTVTRSNNSGNVTSAQTAIVSGNIRLSYYYPGTGKTYNGFSGTEGIVDTGRGYITYPTETTFNADGFFVLEGTVNNPSSYNYAFIIVTKDSDPDNLRTTYFVRNNYKQRIWLRFGSGAYTIQYCNISADENTFALNGEGDWIGSFSYITQRTFNVTNTNNEGDMRFIYPSYLSQSDDPLITNIATELTQGKTDNAAKLRAINNYITQNTVYDSASKAKSERKKQDALTVLGTRYRNNSLYPNGHFLAVCEGYANTFTAIARAAGFQTRYVSSQSMNHAWNHVYVNGAWYFVDVTWNDPTPDQGPNAVITTYFLLASLNGVSNSHYGWEVNNGRAIINVPTAPWRHGGFEGWY